MKRVKSISKTINLECHLQFTSVLYFKYIYFLLMYAFIYLFTVTPVIQTFFLYNNTINRGNFFMNSVYEII